LPTRPYLYIEELFYPPGISERIPLVQQPTYFANEYRYQCRLAGEEPNANLLQFYEDIDALHSKPLPRSLSEKPLWKELIGKPPEPIPFQQRIFGNWGCFRWWWRYWNPISIVLRWWEWL